MTERDAGGRVDKRTVAGRVYEYEHDARGQLSSCTDNQDSSNNAQYAYDHMARRIKMTIGDSVYRFVYDGNDVAVEFCDEDGDSDVDRTRVYWLMPELDQRIGFVDVLAGETNIYYYLCDQVGSVIQVIDESGDVVNQYVYDAYGNVSWDSTNTFEGVENRYLFQGREWDANRQEYYFRYRTYIPEWGSFAGPDMNLSRGILGERHGVMSYVAFGNNPLDVRDPMGLQDVLVAIGPSYGTPQYHAMYKHLRSLKRYILDLQSKGKAQGLTLDVMREEGWTLEDLHRVLLPTIEGDTESANYERAYEDLILWLKSPGAFVVEGVRKVPKYYVRRKKPGDPITLTIDEILDPLKSSEQPRVAFVGSFGARAKALSRGKIKLADPGVIGTHALKSMMYGLEFVAEAVSREGAISKGEALQALRVQDLAVGMRTTVPSLEKRRRRQDVMWMERLWQQWRIDMLIYEGTKGSDE